MSGSASTLVDALAGLAERSPDTVAFRTLVDGGASTERSWTWRAWAEDAWRVAAGLRAVGVAPGDRVAVLASNTPVWPIADLAILRVGAVSVGLYPTSAPAQVEEILDDAGARVVFVDDAGQLEKVRAVAHRLPTLSRIVVCTDEAWSPGGEVRSEPEAPSQPTAVAHEIMLDDLIRHGDVGALDEVDPPEPDADAVLIYTSGSTGAPKGARLTHRTLVASAESVRDTLGLRSDDRMLSFLPFSHAAERIFGQATRLLVGIECGLVLDAKRVFEAAAGFRPTVFGGLPRFYERMYEAELAERGPEAQGPSPAIERMTGGAVRIATSGGATLPAEVAGGLQRLGLTVLGAYGLTEHLCCTFNRPGDPRFDDVGTPMPGTEIRIASDGEILIRRSDLTFAGYHDRPDATRAAFTDDGVWLHTGDLGRLGPGGRLTVTGRRKELIALSTGKKVAPLPIEARLVEQPWIGQAVLVGEGRKFIGALLTLRRPVVERWAAEEEVDLPWEVLVRDERVVERVARQVEEVNRRVSRTESVRRFEILADPLTVDAGELTPTLKPKRTVILQRHADRIDTIYGAAVA